MPCWRRTPTLNFKSYDANDNGALDVTELHLIIIVRGFEESYGGSSYACSPNVWGHSWSLYGTVPAPVLDGVSVAASASGGGYTQQGEWHALDLFGLCYRSARTYGDHGYPGTRAGSRY